MKRYYIFAFKMTNFNESFQSILYCIRKPKKTRV